MFLSNNHALFHLRWKENLIKHQRSQDVIKMILVALKSRQVKQNSQEWFDCGFAEKKVVAINYLKNLKNWNFILTKKYKKHLGKKCKNLSSMILLLNLKSFERL